MFKISEFSKISQVSVKTLRYYDQLNLLKPDFTDKHTGYRYYSADQMLQLNRILAYKELGFSLDQIRQMLDEQIPIEQIRGMFRVKQNEILSILDREQARLARIKDRLSFIENEGTNLTRHDVILKEVEPQFVMSYRQRASLSQIPELFRQLDSQLSSSAPSSLTQMVLWHGCDECDDDIDIEVARVLPQELTSRPPFIVKQLPQVVLMATLVHHCRTTAPCIASTELALWIERNGYRMIENEPRREICLPHDKSIDPEAYIAEVQIAVVKA